jgi:hypothetical protein
VLRNSAYLTENKRLPSNFGGSRAPKWRLLSNGSLQAMPRKQAKLHAEEAAVK